jgi:hypothetical protein
VSTELGTLHNTGSRKVDMTVARYWGGTEPCYQLTAQQENGDWGYVQLTRNEIALLLALAHAFEEPDSEKFTPGDET